MIIQLFDVQMLQYLAGKIHVRSDQLRNRASYARNNEVSRCVATGAYYELQHASRR